MSSRGISVPFVSATSSYSRCANVTRGGSRASRRRLCHTGKMDGELAPRAISPTALMNWTNPAASLIVWLRRRAKMKPPHLRRVTCEFKAAQQHYWKRHVGWNHGPEAHHESIQISRVALLKKTCRVHNSFWMLMICLWMKSLSIPLFWSALLTAMDHEWFLLTLWKNIKLVLDFSNHYTRTENNEKEYIYLSKK